jgi:hypothetical protein
MELIEKLDTNSIEFKTWLLGLLHDDNISDLCVTFTKKDGSERKLYCTLVGSRIPAEKTPKEDSGRRTSEEALRVFDVESQDWRSFRWDSVLTVNFSLS